MEKLINTDALERGKFHGIESWTPVEASSWQRGWNDAIDAIISNVSTVDAPEVVRCKDCIHRFKDGENVVFNCCELNHNKVQADDWFCADAERREDETG